MTDYICYVPKKFNAEHLSLIGMANKILKDHADKGFGMTLRSLYYQFVGKALIPNTVQSYNRLGTIISDARLAGLVSWTALADNMRSLEGKPFVSGPKEAIQNARDDYALDLWAGQPYRPEVWVEKDAMVGVIQGICIDLRVNFFACRGYASQTSLWQAGRRLAGYIHKGQQPIIFHFGDHDPSGIDMTRDNAARVAMFAGTPVPVVRLSLNMDQVQEYNLPPNPAKMTDSRFADYQDKYGDESWELDAVDPEIIANLIASNVARIRDESRWSTALAQEADDLDTLDLLIENMGTEEEGS